MCVLIPKVGEHDIALSYLRHSPLTFQRDSHSDNQQQSTGLFFEALDIDCTIASYFADQIFERFPKIALVAYYRDDGEGDHLDRNA